MLSTNFEKRKLHVPSAAALEWCWRYISSSSEVTDSCIGYWASHQLIYVGFTPSYATKAFRESRCIALLYF